MVNYLIKIFIEYLVYVEYCVKSQNIGMKVNVFVVVSEEFLVSWDEIVYMWNVDQFGDDRYNLVRELECVILIGGDEKGKEGMVSVQRENLKGEEMIGFGD